uniref:Uncharacterized protein n=1 Tax=Arundo donax TaxID=35708 RepID=A0A0A9B100_ARUDO
MERWLHGTTLAVSGSLLVARAAARWSSVVAFTACPRLYWPLWRRPDNATTL